MITISTAQVIFVPMLLLPSSASTFFDDVNVSLDITQKMVVGRDGLGNERFRVSLAPNSQRMPFAFNGLNGSNASLNYVSVNGNLLLLSLGYQLLAVDTLRTSSENANHATGARALPSTMRTTSASAPFATISPDAGTSATKRRKASR